MAPMFGAPVQPHLALHHRVAAPHMRRHDGKARYRVRTILEKFHRHAMLLPNTAFISDA
jgi:hypothetical protein